MPTGDWDEDENNSGDCYEDDTAEAVFSSLQYLLGYCTNDLFIKHFYM